MTVKKRGLGRGLDALLGGGLGGGLDAGVGIGQVHAIPPTVPEHGLRKLPLDKIRPSRYQPRTEIRPEALEELARSISAQGVVQPIVVRSLRGSDGFELIAGERRWRAAQMAGLDQIPAVVRDVPDQTALAIALIENIQREDLNPLEEAAALQRLVEEFDLTHEEAAQAVGRSRAAVSNLLRLLELHPDVKRLMEADQLEMGHARALLGLKEPAQQRAIAQKVVAKGLSVRETEALVRRLQAEPADGQPEKRPDPDILRLEEDLSQRLGTMVRFQQGAKGKGGKLVIHYNNLDELDGILMRIR
jgi:ParB family chromosome partitioning protein